MKIGIYKLLLLFLLVFLIRPTVYAIQKGDTLLVYFTTDNEINKLYADLIQIQNKEIVVIETKNLKAFYEFIPEEYYLRRTKTFSFGNAASNSKDDQLKVMLKSLNDSDTQVIDSSDSRLNNRHLYFFDIRSTIKVASYYVDQGGMSVPRFYTYMAHQLELVNYSGKAFKSTKVSDLKMYSNYSKDTVVSLYKMDESTDLIDPLLISFYTKRQIHPDLLNVGTNGTCVFGKTDTIFINGLLNGRHLYGNINASKQSYTIPNQISFFKHKHFYSNGHDISRRALASIQAGKAFYFYFFELNPSVRSNYYIVDVLDFKVVAYHTEKPYSQKKKTIKSFTKFKNNCKQKR